MIKKYKTNHVKEHKKQQHCVTCNRYVTYDERYPDYVCKKCVELAIDKGGKSVTFFNITDSGHGCQGKYVDDGKLCRGTTCFIKGVRCFAEEAYFGGIVIRPFKRNRKAGDILEKLGSLEP
ncbi:hypothetical protein EWM62_08615 [Mucilaginibacter terrigena]|uniref:Uncharacterized protein n=1 Tax=Mucilaginibacter terrigena TaxID=2492395 RepID=A0A4Q5LNK4_9SPHI|nr:hypothetical protein [Mucilaginibacter terrigena]RYU90699.1 hypothetical protein EWM62_08615 [Mucilaginibacter terrigena]